MMIPMFKDSPGRPIRKNAWSAQAQWHTLEYSSKILRTCSDWYLQASSPAKTILFGICTGFGEVTLIQAPLGIVCLLTPKKKDTARISESYRVAIIEIIAVFKKLIVRERWKSFLKRLSGNSGFCLIYFHLVFVS